MQYEIKNYLKMKFSLITIWLECPFEAALMLMHPCFNESRIFMYTQYIDSLLNIILRPILIVRSGLEPVS